MAYPPESYLRSFMMHRNALLGLLDKIPEDQAGFQAWDDGMSFKALTDHLASSSGYVSDTIEGGAPNVLEPSENLAAAKARLHEKTGTLKQTLSGLDETKLNTMVEVLGGQNMPLYAFIDFMREHEAHHKGQLWAMARMIGVAPGSFVSRN